MNQELLEHVGHELELVPVKGYSPVWGEGNGLELRCKTDGQLLGEYAVEREDYGDEEADEEYAAQYERVFGERPKEEGEQCVYCGSTDTHETWRGVETTQHRCDNCDRFFRVV